MSQSSTLSEPQGHNAPSISLYFLVLIRVGDLDGDGNYKSYWIFTGYSRDARGTEED